MPAAPRTAAAACRNWSRRFRRSRCDPSAWGESKRVQLSQLEDELTELTGSKFPFSENPVSCGVRLCQAACPRTRWEGAVPCAADVVEPRGPLSCRVNAGRAGSVQWVKAGTIGVGISTAEVGA